MTKIACLLIISRFFKKLIKQKLPTQSTPIACNFMKIDRILLIDDDDNVRRGLTEVLKREGYTVLGVSSELQARESIEKEEFDLIISDLMLSNGPCTDLLRWVRQTQPKIQFIIMTGFASIETAIEAIRLGVFDYLLKPVNPRELSMALQRLETYETLRIENSYLKKELTESLYQDQPIWGKCKAMQEIVKLIDRVAPTDATVLIQGESGTGKEVVAYSIFSKSTRVNQPFIKVNCAAVPEALLESEFFGHERGAFTGAVQRRIGRFEMANNGTIFLDEIAEIPLSLQVKLLRAIQQQEFERVGGGKTLKVNIRILAATNRDLKDEVRKGRFREDLYYRLNVVPIILPPLRERGQDIETFSDYFLKRFAHKHGKNILGFTPQARAKLAAYGWPGNVRELQNVIERAVILAIPNSHLDAGDFVLTGSPKETGNWMSGPLPTIEEMEMRLISLMLKRTGNNKSQTAKQLGVSVRTIRNKLEEYSAKGLNINAIADASEGMF